MGVDAAGETRTESEAEGLVPFVKKGACAMVAQQQRLGRGRIRKDSKSEENSRRM